MHFFFINIFI